MPPSSAQKRGGPSGSGRGTSARSARIRLPRRWAAASSGGKTAAADMSSTDPAWMPPISGSANVPTTFWPSLRATSGPMARSPIGPRTSGRGSSASPASANRTPRPEMPDAPSARTGSGSPSRAPRAERAAGHGPIPTHRASRSGRGRRRDRPRWPGQSPRAGARGIRPPPCRRPRPAESSLRSAPPSRAEASITTTSGAPACASAATAQLPRGSQAADAAADHDDPPRRHVGPDGHDQIGQHLDENRVVVERLGPRIGEAGLRRDVGHLDVEVIEHFEMVGDEADRADHDGIGRRRRRRADGPRRARRARARAQVCAPRSARPRPSRPGPPPWRRVGRIPSTARDRCHRPRACARVASAR